MESKWNLFVGDLESSVNDNDLWAAFSHYKNLVGARVLVDSESHKSKGYGFVSFASEQEAEQALKEMNKTMINGREIRVNWAVQKVSLKNSTFDRIYNSSSEFNSTVYVGNYPDSIIKELATMFGEFGYVLDLKVCKGFSFVKMDSHHTAALSILNLNGIIIDGSMLKVAWGKEKYSWAQFMPSQVYMYPSYLYNAPFAYPNIIQPIANDHMRIKGNQENTQTQLVDNERSD